MLKDKPFSTRLEVRVQILDDSLRAGHRAQHLYSHDSVDTSLLDATFLEILNADADDFVDPVETSFLDPLPESRMVLQIRLDAIDFQDVSRLTASEEVDPQSGSGTNVEDYSLGIGEEWFDCRRAHLGCQRSEVGPESSEPGMLES